MFGNLLARLAEEGCAALGGGWGGGESGWNGINHNMCWKKNFRFGGVFFLKIIEAYFLHSVEDLNL